MSQNIQKVNYSQYSHSWGLISVTFCNHNFQVSQSQGSWASPWHSLKYHRWWLELKWTIQCKCLAPVCLRNKGKWWTHTNHPALSELSATINWSFLPFSCQGNYWSWTCATSSSITKCHVNWTLEWTWQVSLTTTLRNHIVRWGAVRYVVFNRVVLRL